MRKLTTIYIEFMLSRWAWEVVAKLIPVKKKINVFRILMETGDGIRANTLSHNTVFFLS